MAASDLALLRVRLLEPRLMEAACPSGQYVGLPTYSSPSLELHSDHYLDLLHDRPEFKFSATIVCYHMYVITTLLKPLPGTLLV